MLEKNISNQYNLKQKQSKLKVLSVPFLSLKNSLPFADTLPLLNSNWNNKYTKKNVKHPHVFLK
jgi:hypothetical protein